MQTKLPITVIILAHQANKLLSRALDSVAWATEIIIVDTTVDHQLKKALTSNSILKIVAIPLVEPIDFSLVRNQARTHATQPFVLFLDSDEQVTTDSVPELAQLCQSSNQVVYTITRQDIFYNQPLRGGEGRQKIVRFGPTPLMQFHRPVHEVVSHEFQHQSQINIIHHAHPSITGFWQKISWYSRLEAEWRFQQHRPWNWWEVIIYPPVKFFTNYVIKAGWIDGWPGFIYAFMMSCHSLMVRVHHYEQIHTKTTNP